MGRRRTKKQSNLLFIIYISLIALYLVGQFVNWLTSLSPFIWFSIAFGVALLVGISRHISTNRKKKEAALRKLEFERRGSLNQLRQMSPIAFEYYVCEMFKQLNYDAHVTKATGDCGKDILIYKKDFHGIVECKRYVKSKVTRPHIQKFHSAIIDCKADKGYFITTGEFTCTAVSYVLDKPIELIDGQRLVKLIEEVTKEDCQLDHIDMILKIT
ncbi:restriction endonuclease [Virgibacillus halodenitrificans]|uniref:restriction endonuclease n=1 Tax=Virgibacillus TaxID=84406 RepID=UPI0004D0BD9E|nr:MULTISPECIES: restriction endonuclease [Virgibacillus]AIF42987.1 restriction endonuclease [Virgibacillus sp. SK37]MCG1028889.1 restriction endonuclease [Virgibacillus halodenitrificans]